MSRSLPYRLHGISITITSRERLQDIYVVTARAKDRTGREDESIGAVALGNLKGDALANALMKAETKSKRRVTLSIAGLGWLDETEVSTIPGATIHPSAPPPFVDAAPMDGATAPEPPVNGHGRLPAEARLIPDQARELKRLAQHAFGGYQAGEAQLRHDLGFEVDEKLSLRHIAAHTTVAQFEALRAAYKARLQDTVETDVP